MEVRNWFYSNRTDFVLFIWWLVFKLQHNGCCIAINLYVYFPVMITFVCMGYIYWGFIHFDLGAIFKERKKNDSFLRNLLSFQCLFFWGETSIFKKCQIAQVLVQNHATRKPAASVRFPSRFLPCRTLENPAGLLQIQPVPFVSGSMKTNRSPTNASTSSASPASWNGRRYVGRSSWLLQSNLNCCRVLHSGQARMPAMQARVQLHTSQHPFEWRLWRVQNRNHGAGRTRPLGPGSRPQQIPLQVRQAQYRPQGPSQSSEHVVVGGQDDPHSRQAQAPGVAAAHTDAGFRERNTPNNPDQTEKGEANRDQ